MTDKKSYKKVITEIIQKQIIILGPDIALLKAKKVKGLKIDEKGKVIEIKGRPKDILQQVIDEYISLSGQIFRSVISPLLKKYPDVVANTV